MNQELEPNTEISRYRIVSKLGAGGMGDVYAALDTQLDRKVALKILPVEFASDRGRMNRFIQEAKSASALNHPNIITIYEIGEADSINFIASEYITGKTLRKWLKKQRDLKTVLDIAIQVASALQAAHRAKVVHRDIKPENVMIRPDGLVKVLDFGLAKVSPATSNDGAKLDEASTDILTTPGVVFGTVSYMSPEQTRGQLVDARSDIWSFGVMLYEMVAGRKPFEGETMSDVLAAIIVLEPPSPGENVPAELNQIIQNALRKKPEERYQSITPLLADLRRLRRKYEFTDDLKLATFTRTPGVNEPTIETATATFQPADPVNSLSVTRPISSSDIPQTVSPVGLRTKHRVTIAFAVLAALALTVAGYMAFNSRRNSSNPADSIAVLPFQNKNHDAELDYLSEGLAESLIDRLSSLPQLKVIARSSSFKYKDENLDVRELASALQVKAIISGAFVRNGDDLGVRVEMIDATENRTLWSKQYNFKAAEAVKVEEEIAQAVSENLRLGLTSIQQRQLVKPDTTNPVAYDLLLKARFQARKGGTESRAKAIELLNQAIVADPDYAMAYAVLAARYNSLLNNGSPTKEILAKAELAANKALELDDQLAEAHYAAALVASTAFDWTTAEKEFLRAIELNPSLARAHGGYGQYLSLRGRHEQAITEMGRAKSLDPLSPVITTNVGRLLYFARRNDEAIEALKQTTEQEQTYPMAFVYLADCYVVKGEYGEAVKAYEQAIKLGEATKLQQINLAVAYAKSGRREEARSILKALESRETYVPATCLARLYSAIGERQKVLEMLDKAYVDRDAQLQYIGVDPLYDELRSEPRFQELIRKLAL
ncbi:MAG TPA: protein kinase [Pyrinomonadaceae bacterium]|nr:protein kinase [Pyrinomonadaceae bacterium]